MSLEWEGYSQVQGSQNEARRLSFDPPSTASIRSAHPISKQALNQSLSPHSMLPPTSYSRISLGAAVAASPSTMILLHLLSPAPPPQEFCPGWDYESPQLWSLMLSGLPPWPGSLCVCAKGAPSCDLLTQSSGDHPFAYRQSSCPSRVDFTPKENLV